MLFFADEGAGRARWVVHEARVTRTSAISADKGLGRLHRPAEKRLLRRHVKVRRRMKSQLLNEFAGGGGGARSGIGVGAA